MMRAPTDATQPDDQFVASKPPFSLEAEQALLGAILIDNGALDKVIDFLEPHHFFDLLHGSIYDTACRQISAGRKVTGVTLLEFFRRDSHMSVGDMTVPQYIGHLGANATTTINARDYGQTIYNLYVRRQLILVAEEMARTAYEAAVTFPPKEQIEEAEARLFSLLERGDKGGQVTFKEATGQALSHALKALDGKRAGLPMGLIDLDEKLGGLQPTNLIIIAGRPGMAKSALAGHVAVANAKQGRAVGFFSLEMSAEEIATRVLGEFADVSPDKLRRGKFDRSLRDRLQEFALSVNRLQIIVDETGGLSLPQLASRARRMKRAYDIQLLVIDYLQLMHAGKRTENRVQDVSAITMGLKALAKELAIPVVALSQLSRAVEGRDNKRPQLSDLRESGSIEQDADIVLFLYRDEYYVERNEPPLEERDAHLEWQKKLRDCAGKAEIIIGKHRHGPTGLVHVAFQGEMMRFADLAREARHAA